MKILTVKQPWASLIVSGYEGLFKDIENRDWWTNVGGRVGIHASAKLDMEEVMAASAILSRVVTEWTMADHAKFTAAAMTFPLGAIIGTVHLYGCVRQSKSRWFVGRYGFEMRDPVALREPIKVRGRVGWWDYPLVASV